MVHIINYMNHFIYMKDYKDILLNLKGPYIKEVSVKKRYLDLYLKIVDYTKDYNLVFMQKIWHFLNNTLDIPICRVCKINKCNFSGIDKGYSNYCSTKCATNDSELRKQIEIKKKETCIKKYGVDNPLKNKEVRDKIKETCLERYGVDNPRQSIEISEKIKETCIKRYGVNYTLKSKEVRDKIKETNLERYGNESHLSSEIIRDKIKETNLERYGNESPFGNRDIIDKIKIKNLENYNVEYNFQREDIKEKIKETHNKKYGVNHYLLSDKYKEIKFKEYDKQIRERYNSLNIKEVYENGTLDFYCSECKDYKNINIHLLHQRYKFNNELCTICNPLYSSVNYTSKSEEEIKEFIESLNIETKKDRTILNGNEIDVYIEDYKIGFEHNGVYWHNEFNKPKDYHLDKTVLAKERGVKLVHIWEDLWLNKQEIVKSRILNLLNLSPNKIYARKCIVKKASSSDSREFLNMNHLQGNANAAVKLGLYYNDELVLLMTFGSLRKNLGQKAIEGDYELTRFANKLNTTVVGGASRLFKHFIKEYKPERLISYADCDWSPNEQDNLYTKLGFNYLGHTGLNYWWVVDGIRENRFKFRKDILVKEGADPSMTEVEIMHDKGYYRCFGTGNYKFEWDKMGYIIK